jgi:PRTRC genetic system ThiF family protein
MIMSPDFINTFATNGFKKLQIVVVGAGGTGSSLLGKLLQLHNTFEGLALNGLDVVVYDDDVVTESNIGRMPFYNFDLGRPKAECLVERFNAYSNVNWQYKNERFKKDSLKNTYGGVVIFGCVDNVPARKAIHTAFSNLDDCIYIDSGNDASSANIIMAMNAQVGKDRCYLPSVVDLYQQQINSHIDNNKDSCSAEDAINKQTFGVNDMAASQCIQFLWQLVRQGEIAYQGVSFDLKTGVTSPIYADADTWSMYGYVPNESVKTHH